MRWIIGAFLLVAPPAFAAAPPAEKTPAPQPTFEELRLARDSLLESMVRDYGYSLQNGQAVKHIPQPTPAIALDFYRAEQGGVASGPDASFFRYRDGKLVGWGNTFAGGKQKGYTLAQLLDSFFGLKGRLVEGSPSLLQKNLPGDWIILDSALQLPGDAPAQLEKILAKDFDFHVKLEMREVERPAIVVRGTYKYAPTRLDAEKEKADPDQWDVLRIYEDESQLNEEPGGAGGGDFGLFLNWLGEAIDAIVIDERSSQTEGVAISWRRHTESQGSTARDRTRTNAASVLKNIESQTGLTFTHELRPVNVMFVTPAKKN
ncbi:hypothetical protein Pan44_24360 [Caulifigura coniformis]|uniref:Uncharacterized protein n=1 Tax=Caulifigura coniformis TaxID=2527983 RepID=A0A517SE54_9PLAN|nr:hypothetical protein [Caulifigura coniformis]QDT54403.1 hypothetical protein Pan44_24360 [Caulifigura coniformis]